MHIRFDGVEDYVPSLDASRPAFGIITSEDNRAIKLVFAEGTPVKAQETVLEEVRAHFTDRGRAALTSSTTLFEISALANEVLALLVHEGQLKQNKFTQQWVWLGDS